MIETLEPIRMVCVDKTSKLLNYFNKSCQGPGLIFELLSIIIIKSISGSLQIKKENT